MDALQNLNDGVDRLLARLETLAQENKELRADLQEQEQLVAKLQYEIKRLTTALENEALRRAEAIGRLNIVIGDLNKYTCQW